MSAEDRRQVEELTAALEAAQAFNKRWNVAKIVTFIAGCIAVIFTVGQQVGDWKNWRGNTDRRIDKLEAATMYKANRQITLK